MKFSKVYGKVPDDLKALQEKMSTVFLELATRPDSSMPNSSKLGGDPLIFALMMPIEHVLTNAIPTAATDGKRYYWGIELIRSSSYLKLRLICHHEAFHAQLMHPQRIGNRNPKLWNIAADYIVMGMIFDYLKHHFKTKHSYEASRINELAISTFREAFGNYITLDQLKLKYANPTNKVPGTENWTPEPFDLAATKKEFNIEDALSPEEEEALKDYAQKWRYCYADPDLPTDMKLPERIYDELLKVIPKCSTCGRVGIYHPPGKKEAHDPHCPVKDEEGHCDECCSGYDILDFGGTIDQHLPCDVDPQTLARRLNDAVDMANRAGKPGFIPAGLLGDIGALSAPKIRWVDDIRLTRSTIAARGNRNDYTRFRSRPMSMGLYLPKKKSYRCKFACLLDTSGSVSRDQTALGVSQLQSLDGGGEGTLVCCDATIYWDDAIKLTSLNAEALQDIKTVGGGGTRLGAFFDDYQEKLGEQDMLIVISDGELFPDDVAAMKDPAVPVYWLIAGNTNFQAPFGKVFQLED